MKTTRSETYQRNVASDWLSRYRLGLPEPASCLHPCHLCRCESCGTATHHPCNSPSDPRSIGAESSRRKFSYTTISYMLQANGSHFMSPRFVDMKSVIYDRERCILSGFDIIGPLTRLYEGYKVSPLTVGIKKCDAWSQIVTAGLVEAVKRKRTLPFHFNLSPANICAT